MSRSERVNWSAAGHENAVENFYGRGVENYGDFHDGYLNFGLWEDGVTDFIAAAEKLVHRVGTMAGLDRESRILDVACGMGTQDVYFIRHFEPRHITALDVTWKHIERGQRRVRDAGLEDRVEFVHGTATELSFADNSFTHVIGIEGPVHFNTREKFMREAARVLEPGGVIAIADYCLKRAPRNLFERCVLGATVRVWKVPAENIDTPDAYRAKLERSGFRDVEIEQTGESVIPGYYFEQRRPETMAEMTKIRGFVGGRIGTIIDVAVYRAYRMGLIDYIFVRARKA